MMDQALNRLQSWEDVEIDLLLQGIYHRYGFDFREYERPLLKQKLHAFLLSHQLSSISTLQDRILHDPQMGDTFLSELNARSAGLFDDPENIALLRKIAIPWLRSHPSPRVWLADCVAAEEVCTLAILLDEEDLYGKTQIFATGKNETLLREASTGGVARDCLPASEENFKLSGGTGSLSDYFDIDAGRAVISPRLRVNITWAEFNLQTDASFNEFQLIICRRVLVDFGRDLQRRALQLFHESLPIFGLLNVDGTKECSLPPFSNWHKPISPGGNLYKRMA